MKKEEAVKQIKEMFPNLVFEIVESFNEITLEVKKDSVKEILSFLHRAPKPGYEVLIDLTGVDYLEPEIRTKVVYLLHNPTNYERIRIVVFTGRNETLPSVTDLWEGANWYERELYDLFGITFEGHPNLKRLLMPDNWEGHPLRKDYPLTEEPVEFKHGVKPKVPSRIIPHVKKAIGNETHEKIY